MKRAGALRVVAAVLAACVLLAIPCLSASAEGIGPGPSSAAAVASATLVPTPPFATDELEGETGAEPASLASVTVQSAADPLPAVDPPALTTAITFGAPTADGRLRLTLSVRYVSPAARDDSVNVQLVADLTNLVIPANPDVSSSCVWLVSSTSQFFAAGTFGAPNGGCEASLDVVRVGSPSGVSLTGTGGDPTATSTTVEWLDELAGATGGTAAMGATPATPARATTAATRPPTLFATPSTPSMRATPARATATATAASGTALEAGMANDDARGARATTTPQLQGLRQTPAPTPPSTSSVPLGADPASAGLLLLLASLAAELGILFAARRRDRLDDAS